MKIVLDANVLVVVDGYGDFWGIYDDYSVSEVEKLLREVEDVPGESFEIYTMKFIQTKKLLSIVVEGS